MTPPVWLFQKVHVNNWMCSPFLPVSTSTSKTKHQETHGFWFWSFPKLYVFEVMCPPARVPSASNFRPDDDMTSTACLFEMFMEARSMLTSIRAFNVNIRMSFEVHIHIWRFEIAVEEIDVFASACDGHSSKTITIYVCSTHPD